MFYNEISQCEFHHFHTKAGRNKMRQNIAEMFLGVLSSGSHLILPTRIISLEPHFKIPMKI